MKTIKSFLPKGLTQGFALFTVSSKGMTSTRKRKIRRYKAKHYRRRHSRRHNMRGG